MARSVVAIALIAFVGVFAVWGFQAALAEAGENELVVNETWTPSAGSVTQLDNSGLAGAYYGNDTTVYDENQTEMDRGTDYTWFEGNGTVKALAGGGLDGDSEATITYTYEQTTSEQRALASILAMWPRILGAILPVLGIIVLLILLSG